MMRWQIKAMTQQAPLEVSKTSLNSISLPGLREVRVLRVNMKRGKDQHKSGQEDALL